ncbi:MAG: hypothetical protein QGH73_19390 [Rhodospirillales bacterium]|nr:hypothetical protein [Rhodospirillales bacterium]
MIDQESLPVQSPVQARALYAAEGLGYMPQLLSLIDQNPLSPTYGCGDRPYWLYKSTDYSCGMYGEFALPLAQVYVYSLPDNPYHGVEKIRDLSVAVMKFYAADAHADGSADDFYPFERAMGATAFTLYAMAEAVQVLSLEDQGILEFLHRRARWLAATDEAGRLSNHHALRVLALAMVARMTNDSELEKTAAKHRDELLSWQSEEGWFPEYDGFDLGYHSFTFTFLGYLRQLTGDDLLTGPLARAADLTADLMGADGSFGGETGSRNSFHFLPHGYELLAPELGSARFAADRFLAAMSAGNRGYLEDNRTFCHYQYNFLQAWRDFADRENCPDWEPAPGIQNYDDAGLIRIRGGRLHTLISTRKGGIVKASDRMGAVASDTGIILKDNAGKLAAPAVNGADDVKIETSESGATTVRVQTDFAYISNSMSPTPGRFIVFRVLNLTLGRWFPNLLRGLLLKLLVKPASRLPLGLMRTIKIADDEIQVTDHIQSRANGSKFTALMASTDLTTLYTASSNPWHPTRRFAWTDHTDRIGELNETGSVEISRTWRRENP